MFKGGKFENKNTIAALYLACALVSGAAAQSEEKRIERLSDLAKIWGAVKYFYPFPAYKEIDWDKALIETIPKAGAAKSPEEYAGELDGKAAMENNAQYIFHRGFSARK